MVQYEYSNIFLKTKDYHREDKGDLLPFIGDIGTYLIRGKLKKKKKLIPFFVFRGGEEWGSKWGSRSK